MGEGVYHWHRSMISLVSDLSHWRESYDPSFLGTSVLVYHQTLDHREMGTRTGDWFESRQWKNKFCIHPLSPKPPFCAPVWWLMGQHFPSKREGHPSQLPWQCRPLPSIKKKSLLLLSSLLLLWQETDYLRMHLLGSLLSCSGCLAVCPRTQSFLSFWGLPEFHYPEPVVPFLDLAVPGTCLWESRENYFICNAN